MGNKNKKIIYSIVILAIVSAIIMYAAHLYQINPIKQFNTFIEEQDYQSAVEIYNEKIAGSPYDEQCRAVFRTFIEDNITKWDARSIDYNDVVTALQLMEVVNNDEISCLTTEKLEYVCIEYDGDLAYQLATVLYSEKQYAQVMAAIITINENYSGYGIVSQMYIDCKNAVLESVSSPATISDYEEAIQILSSCLVDVDEIAFKDRIVVLENELTVLKDIADILENAALKALDGDYKAVFEILESGHKKYPNENDITTMLSQYQDVFIMDMSVKAMRLCEEYNYEEAEQIVTEAIGVYDNGDLKALLEIIKEDKKPLNKIKNMISKKCTNFVKTLEDNGTVDYVSGSLEKLALGDYSDEENTLLSTGASVAASLVNADLPMDIRDLTHCLTNPKDHTTTDYVINTLALVPLIGSIKFIDDILPTVIKTTDKVSDTAELVNDGFKNIPVINKISETFSNTKKSATKFLNKHTKAAEELITKCNKYKGGLYPETNVKIVNKKIALSDGRVLKGAFPVFESKINIYLPDHLLKESEYWQNKYLNDELIRKAGDNKGIKELKKTFSDDEIDLLKQGIIPSGYTWHHNEEEGLMQLVDTMTHAAVKHTGGMHIWGRGY